MQVFRAEMLKLKRSLAWVVVVLLPVCVAGAGAVSTLTSSDDAGAGWDVVWLRSVVFYGLFPLAIGVAVLASLVWRAEHRGGNWNALMSGPTSTMRLVAAKAGTVMVLVLAMQAVMAMVVWALGTWVYGADGVMPLRYLGISALITVACVPLAVLQSALSMVMRSFAAPVAVAFLGAGVSAVLLMAGGSAAAVSPYALVARATQAGTGTFADSGVITGGLVGGVVVLAGLLSVALVAASVSLLNRRDVHA